MLRITLVSYLNTKPFVEGLSQEFSPGEILLDLRPPSGCASAFENRECDLALLPAGALFHLPDAEIVSNFCIGSRSKVDSVFLFSNEAASEIHTVILDPDSRTSNRLARILFARHWKRPVRFLEGKDRNFRNMERGVARVAIGDVAHSLRSSFPYVYDLSEEWKKMTGLPFVFAIWVAPAGSMDEGMNQRLNRAFSAGVLQIRQAAEKYAGEFGYSVLEAIHYLGESLDFHFDSDKVDALRLFLTLGADSALSDETKPALKQISQS